MSADRRPGDPLRVQTSVGGGTVAFQVDSLALENLLTRNLGQFRLDRIDGRFIDALRRESPGLPDSEIRRRSEQLLNGVLDRAAEILRETLDAPALVAWLQEESGSAFDRALFENPTLAPLLVPERSLAERIRRLSELSRRRRSHAAAIQRGGDRRTRREIDPDTDARLRDIAGQLEPTWETIVPSLRKRDFATAMSLVHAAWDPLSRLGRAGSLLLKLIRRGEVPLRDQRPRDLALWQAQFEVFDDLEISFEGHFYAASSLRKNLRR